MHVTYIHVCVTHTHALYNYPCLRNTKRKMCNHTLNVHMSHILELCDIYTCSVWVHMCTWHIDIVCMITRVIIVTYTRSMHAYTFSKLDRTWRQIKTTFPMNVYAKYIHAMYDYTCLRDTYAFNEWLHMCTWHTYIQLWLHMCTRHIYVVYLNV